MGTLNKAPASPAGFFPTAKLGQGGTLMSCSWCGSCCLEEGFPGVLCSVSTSRLAPCHSLNRHPNLSASWLGREMPSLSGSHLPKVLSSCCASWAVIQPRSLPSLPALVGVLWGGAVLCPLQPPGKVQWCWSLRVVGLFDGL